jgi:hypothetical protein
MELKNNTTSLKAYKLLLLAQRNLYLCPGRGEEKSCSESDSSVRALQREPVRCNTKYFLRYSNRRRSRAMRAVQRATGSKMHSKGSQYAATSNILFDKVIAVVLESSDWIGRPLH